MQSLFVKDNDNFQDMQEIKSQNVSRFWVTYNEKFHTFKMINLTVIKINFCKCSEFVIQVNI